MRLKNKVALITGSAGGIGRRSALLFASEGAAVVVADVDEAGDRGTVEEVTQAGGEAAFVRADVSQAVDCEQMVAFAQGRYGKLNALFNNAGMMHPGDDSILTTTDDVWERTIAVNLKGVYLGCKYGIPALLSAGGGSIINMASCVALMGAATPQIAYTASKGGVLSMAREIAVAFARRNVRATALCPGPVDTPLLAKLLADPARRQRRMVHIPMGRLAQANEVAQAALFLASDDSSYVNGATFSVDGGITAAYVTPEDS